MSIYPHLLLFLTTTYVGFFFLHFQPLIKNVKLFLSVYPPPRRVVLYCYFIKLIFIFFHFQVPSASTILGRVFVRIKRIDGFVLEKIEKLVKSQAD